MAFQKSQPTVLIPNDNDDSSICQDNNDDNSSCSTADLTAPCSNVDPEREAKELQRRRDKLAQFGQIFAECLLEMNDKDKEQARVVMDHLKRRLLGPVKFHNYFKDVADTLHVLVATYGRDENNPHPLVKKAIYATRAVQNYEGLPEWMGRLDLHGAISNALGLDEVDNLSEVTAHAVRTKSAAVE